MSAALGNVNAVRLDAEALSVHNRALIRSRGYSIAEYELLDSIIEVDRERLFLKFHLTHLTTYCVKLLNLSEEVAATYVRVARKSLEVPELKEAIRDGLKLTKAKTIVSVLTQMNFDHWIEKARVLSKRELEEEVAAASPDAPRPERVRPTGPDRYRAEFDLNKVQLAIAERARDLVSQKLGHAATMQETCVVALTEYVRRHDPVAKAGRASRKARDRSRERSSPAEASKAERKKRRRSRTPSEVTHAVNQRDRNRCQYRMPDGTICGSRRWTQHHHIVPLADGGADCVENIVTLCATHHRLIHENENSPGP